MLFKKKPEMITLLGNAQNNSDVVNFSIANPDATLTPFTIPNNKLFVVTDMGVTFTSAAPNKNIFVTLLLFGGNTITVIRDVTTSDSDGIGGLQVSLETGTIIAPNVLFGVRVENLLPNGSIGANLHGYLINS